MICYHGTTMKAFESIMNGSEVKELTCWNVSDNDGAFYVYPQDKLNDCFDYEEHFQCIQHAFEQAVNQAPVYDDENLIVMVLDIPDHLLGDDYSCENMAEISSFIPLSDLNLSWLKNVYHAKTNKYYFPVIISTLINNIYFTSAYINHAILKIAEALSETDVYSELLEDIYSFNFEELQINIDMKNYVGKGLQVCLDSYSENTISSILN